MLFPSHQKRVARSDEVIRLVVGHADNKWHRRSWTLSLLVAIKNMGELASLANLGPKSEAMLLAAGIASFSQLQQLGSVRAYSLVKASGARVSLNLLWALEGALSGVSWQVVAREHRLSLLLALEELERG